jgi:hypothetical protein
MSTYGGSLGRLESEMNTASTDQRCVRSVPAVQHVFLDRRVLPMLVLDADAVAI